MKVIKNKIFQVRPDAQHDWQNLPAVRGKSAYQVAVDNGYEYDEETWIKETCITKDRVTEGVDIWLDHNPEIVSRAASSVVIQKDKPVESETATVWINPERKKEYNLPEIKDDEINAVDTWSSNKINLECKNNYITPEMFGAKGDGIADDTIAIQKCISMAIEKRCSVNGFNQYKITSPLVINQDNLIIYFNKISYQGESYAINIIDSCTISFSLNELNSKDSGILIKLKDRSTIMNHISLKLGTISCLNNGITFEAKKHGIQYCNIHLEGSIEVENGSALILLARQPETWVGEIKTIGGELRSQKGYGVYVQAIDSAEISALRLIGTSLERCLKGSYFENCTQISYLGSRREQSEKMKFVKKCTGFYFNGWYCKEADLDLTELIPAEGNEQSILFDEPVVLPNTNVRGGSQGIIAQNGKFYFSPEPRIGWIPDDKKGTSENPTLLMDNGRIVTYVQVPADSNIALTKYHHMYGIKQVIIKTRNGPAVLYNSDKEIIGSLAENTTYLILNLYQNDWQIISL